MMRLIILLMLGTSFAADAQDLRLKQCWDKAEQNYPRAKDKPEYEQVARLRIRNQKSGYYPRLDANAQATYQSDVTSIDVSKIPIPNFSIVPSPKDQYKLTLDLSQLVWDGGSIKASKEMELASLAANSSQIDVDIYTLKGRVAQLFFGVALKKEQVRLQKMLKDNLEEKLKTTESMVRNGASLKANEMMIKAEILNLQQEIASAESDKQGMIDALSILMGDELSYNANFLWNEPSVVETSRPEFALFKTQKDMLETANLSYNARRMPKVSAFGQVGYGQPGLNMLSTGFNSYYYVGIRATWNIFDWNSTKHDRQSIKLQQNMVDNKQAAFELTRSMDLAQESKNNSKYADLIKTDERLIEARQEVAKAYSVMYDNGAINASEYIGRQTELKQAELNREMHRVMQALSSVNMSIIKGKE